MAEQHATLAEKECPQWTKGDLVVGSVTGERALHIARVALTRGTSPGHRLSTFNLKFANSGI